MSATQRLLKPGQILFREGEPSRSIFVVKKGAISIRKQKGSAFVEIARIYTNEVIGELSFFDRLPRSATAVAISPSEVMEISFDSLDKIYDKIPDYMKTIMAAMADRLRKANEIIRKLQKTSSDTSGMSSEPPAPSAPAAPEAEKPASRATSDNPFADLPDDPTNSGA